MRDKTGAVVVMEVLRLYKELVNPQVFQTVPTTQTASVYIYIFLTTSDRKKNQKTNFWSKMSAPFGKHANKSLPLLFIINVCFP